MTRVWIQAPIRSWVAVQMMILAMTQAPAVAAIQEVTQVLEMTQALIVVSTQELTRVQTLVLRWALRSSRTVLSEVQSASRDLYLRSPQFPWAGWANTNADMYPLSFSQEATLTFTAAVVDGGTADVRFRLEFNPYPDIDPAYDTEVVTVTGDTPTEYTIVIPSQGANTFSSFLMYLNTQDVAVQVTDVVLSMWMRGLELEMTLALIVVSTQELTRVQTLVLRWALRSSRTVLSEVQSASRDHIYVPLRFGVLGRLGQYQR